MRYRFIHAGLAFLLLFIPLWTASAEDQGVLSIGGTCFDDYDSSGFLDDGEPGLGGWVLVLMRDGAEIARTETNDQGAYSFGELWPGSYKVAEVLQEGWTQTSPGRGFYEVTLTDRAASRLDFGNYEDEGIAARPEREYPLMRPSKEDLIRWMEIHDGLPKVAPAMEVGFGLETATGFVDLLDYLDYVPSERDQGICGNCWVWAGTGLMEIERAVQTGRKERLSIQYFNSNYNGGSGDDWACCGGLLDLFSGFYSQNDVAVPWSNANAHWQDGTSCCPVSCGSQCSSCATTVPAGTISLNPRVGIDRIEAQGIATFGLKRDLAIANVKGVLDQQKPVWFAFFLPSIDAWRGFFEFWGNQQQDAVWQPDGYCGDPWNDGAGHAVLCVGYNDTDPENPYWIMLNSWGDSENRPDGLFRISMDMDYNCSYVDGDEVIRSFFWETLDVAFQSDSPSRPGITGPARGRPGQELTFSASAVDPKGGRVKYTFDWGDGSAEETGYAASGTAVTASHSWPSGSWQVKAKATTENGAASEWSDALRVQVYDLHNPQSPPQLSANHISSGLGAQKAVGHGTGKASNNVKIVERQ